MVYIRFEGAPGDIEQQLISWIAWAVQHGAAPEALVLDAPVERDLRAELSSAQKREMVLVSRFYGLPVRVGDGLRPREVVLECGYVPRPGS